MATCGICCNQGCPSGLLANHHNQATAPSLSYSDSVSTDFADPQQATAGVTGQFPEDLKL
jgi:hypothetical protein